MTKLKSKEEWALEATRHPERVIPAGVASLANDALEAHRMRRELEGLANRLQDFADYDDVNDRQAHRDAANTAADIRRILDGTK